MSSDAHNQRSRKPSPARERVGLSACVAVVLSASLMAGCMLDGVRPVQSAGAGIVDRSTCEGLYVQSIWKGEDLGGAQCQSHVALAGDPPSYDQRRVKKVCEQTQIRTILSGEASSDFTLQACASHEGQYQQARLGKACRDISRARTRRQEDLTPAQSAVCKTYLEQPGKVAARLASSDAPRWNGFASVPARAVTGEAVAGAERVARVEAAAQRAAAEGTVTESAVAESAVAKSAVAKSAPASVVSPVTAASGGPAGAVEVARTERAICEDRLIESIWKGEDVTGGAACAGYAPEYRLTRIQNVCEGAQIRSDRTGEALPAFTLQACQAALAPPPAATPLPTVAAEPSAPPAELAPPGLDEKAIASTVDANWRSIGRDCSAVAPRSRSFEPLNVAVTVTIDVAAPGQVRQVSVRARGYQELERCIESSVRSWVFPAAERDTEVGIPLVFAGQ